jgi:hypothetical protein
MLRAYYPMSTATPTGFRPWNFGMQGLGRVPRARRMAGMGRLGVNLLAMLPASAQAQVNQIIQYLQQAQSDINATNQAILQGNAAGIDMSDIVAQNQANQTQLSTLIDEFTIGYRTMTGTTPPGLSGLGQVDPASWVTIAGAVAALAILAAAAYALIQQTSANSTNAQARLTQQTTAASAAAQQNTLLNQAAAQYAAGNTSAGDTLTALAQQAGATAVGTSAAASASTGSWFTDPNQALISGIPNWGLLAAAGFVVFLGPDILSTVRKAL